MVRAAPPPPPPPQEPIEVNLRDALEERYLAYALSTIMGRALPDARDGLKPVHRRILYGMHILRLDPGTAFKKCAKIVGDVMGSFHPHGDQAIYEALVRLAQDFASRFPLVEGQGNFGNIDGDNAAAYRYTEARLTDFARLIMEGIDEESVDWRDNYSGDTKEPIVMPAATPNLLANGSQGIAVGMATSIPPHNVAELCDAALYLIAHPQAPVEELLNFCPGPDFPTGGIVTDDRASIAETYRTGRGGFRLRARWMKEDTGRGGWVAVVTEIPYGVQKSRLIEQLADLLNEKKAPVLCLVRQSQKRVALLNGRSLSFANIEKPPHQKIGFVANTAGARHPSERLDRAPLDGGLVGQHRVQSRDDLVSVRQMRGHIKEILSSFLA